MMTKTILQLLSVAGASLLLTGCGFSSGNSNALTPTSPTTNSSTGGGATSSPSSYVGSWASSTLTTLPSASTCGNLQWNVTSQSTTAISGTFTALCAGNLAVSGSASGQLNGATIPMTANGTATAPGFPVACAFDLTGTGFPQTDGSLRIDYSGTTCAGPVSGTETLHHAS